MNRIPKTGEKVWFVIMAKDSVYSGRVISVSVDHKDGKVLVMIKKRFGKLKLFTRNVDFVFSDKDSAKEFYEQNKMLLKERAK